MPSIILTKNGVKIVFPEGTPSIYNYRIERYDYTTHTTVYEGKYMPEFIDTTISKDKRYVYSVTPIYAERIGKSIRLPEIITSTLPQDKIAEKEWWQY